MVPNFIKPNPKKINPTENTIQTIPNDLLLYKSGGKSIMKNNEIISTVRNSATGSVSLAYFDLKGLENYPNISEDYLYRSSDNFFCLFDRRLPKTIPPSLG